MFPDSVSQKSNLTGMGNQSSGDFGEMAVTKKNFCVEGRTPW